MTFHELECVVLTRDLPEHSLREGDLGAIVHVAGTDLEVEFVTADGGTLALVTLPGSAVRRVEATDLVSVRRLRSA